MKFKPPLAPPKEGNENTATPLKKRKHLTIAESNSPPLEGLGVVNI